MRKYDWIIACQLAQFFIILIWRMEFTSFQPTMEIIGRACTENGNFALYSRNMWFFASYTSSYYSAWIVNKTTSKSQQLDYCDASATRCESRYYIKSIRASSQEPAWFKLNTLKLLYYYYSPCVYSLYTFYSVLPSRLRYFETILIFSCIFIF